MTDAFEEVPAVAEFELEFNAKNSRLWGNVWQAWHTLVCELSGSEYPEWSELTECQHKAFANLISTGIPNAPVPIVYQINGAVVQTLNFECDNPEHQ